MINNFLKLLNMLQTYMQKRFFRHQNKPVSELIKCSNQLQCNYFTNIHLLISRFIHFSSETAITTLNENTPFYDLTYRVYRTLSVITQFFPMDPDDRIILSQCSTNRVEMPGKHTSIIVHLNLKRVSKFKFSKSA